jgi:hypothetical protein
MKILKEIVLWLLAGSLGSGLIACGIFGPSWFKIVSLVIASSLVSVFAAILFIFKPWK